MPFLSRTTRETNRVGFVDHQTNSNIGPGSYNPPSSFCAKKPSFTAFSSSSRKNQNTQSIVTPGPGSYETNHRKSTKLTAAGGNFRSKTVRFNIKTTVGDTPGPGEYNAVSTFNKFIKKDKRKIILTNPMTANGIGAAVTWVRIPTAPSIPASNQSYGYEEGSYGELIMQQAPVPGYTGRGADMPGPGEYEVDKNTIHSKPRATDFSKSKSKRTDFSKNNTDTPGPGTYEIGNSTLEVNDYTIEAPSAVFQSKVKRTKESDEDRPGPGAYNYQNSFVKKEVPESMQYFGSTSSRFQEPSSGKASTQNYVGPGTYDVVNITSFKNKRKSLLRGPASIGVGFASTSSRFRRKQDDDDMTPGAGSYDTHKVSSIENDLKNKIASRSGVFGTTTKRFFRATVDDFPGPGAHGGSIDILSKSKNSISKPSGNFASKTTRFDENTSSKEKKPAPGEYEVNMKWVKGKQGLLKSGGERFNDKITTEVPGPGQYSNPVHAMNTGKPSRMHVMISRADRFNTDSSTTRNPGPGPGSYDTEYLYGNLNRPTFNMSIAREMYSIDY